jgi:hypothetical protein
MANSLHGESPFISAPKAEAFPERSLNDARRWPSAFFRKHFLASMGDSGSGCQKIA